jgi:hypothetical protein
MRFNEITEAIDKETLHYVEYEMLSLDLFQKKYQAKKRLEPDFIHNKKIILSLLKHYSLDEVENIYEAMRVFYTSQYGRFNNSLRAGKTPKSTKWVDMYMQHGPKASGTVYRGIDGVYYKTLSKGATITDSGYSAASMDPSIAKYFATRKTKGGVMEISSGANLAVINFIYGHSDEQEVIFPRGTKFKILDIADGKINAAASK